jgi:hypothetical protein
MDGRDTRLPIAEEGRLEPPALVVHGGAGLHSSRDISEADRQRYRDAIRAALTKGHELLTSGAGAVDAVVVAVTVLEDSGARNAGPHGHRLVPWSAGALASSRSDGAAWRSRP